MCDVRDAYDAKAEVYASFTRGALDRVPEDIAWLETFARLAWASSGTIADLGCGPGYVVDDLRRRGADAVGYDISPGQIAQARLEFPDAEFHIGDLSALDVPDGSLGGIVARYSLIHVPPARWGDVFGGWRRVLAPGAPVLVSFFAASCAATHGSPFDHAVTTAYALLPSVVAADLENAGFTVLDVGTRRPLAHERALDHGTVLAREPDR